MKKNGISFITKRLSYAITQFFLKLKDKAIFIVAVIMMATFVSTPALCDNNQQCLSFSVGRDINKVNEFISNFQIKDEEIKGVEIYSSAYDLNGDGSDEYLFYIEIPRFCGLQTGCIIVVFEYMNGSFRNLFKHGIMTNDNFDPREPKHKEYICVQREKNFGWRHIYIKNKGTFTYNSQQYILTK